MNNYIEKVISLATAEVGVVESGANWGKRVQYYIHSLHHDFPLFWCAAFVRRMMLDAAVAEGYALTDSYRTASGLKCQSIPILQGLSPEDFGYCPFLGAYASRKGILETAPQRGDIFLVSNGSRFYHTGLVESVQITNFTSFEGNTNSGGSNNGYGVFHRKRTILNTTRFVRYIDEVKPTVPHALPHLYTLFLGSRDLGKMLLIDGRSWTEVREWGDALGFTVNLENEALYFGTKLIDVELLLMDGKNYAPIRDLVKLSGLKLAIDEKKLTVTVTR